MTSIRYRTRRVTLRDGREVTLRAIRDSDAAEIVQAFERLSPESRRSRFLHQKKALGADELARGVRPRRGLACAVVATVPADDGIDIVGAAQYQPVYEATGGRDADEPVPDPASRDVRPPGCEFAVTVLDDWHGVGLARRLLTAVVNRARRDGYETIEGLVAAGNGRMIDLARSLKFTVSPAPEDGGLVVVRRRLAAG